MREASRKFNGQNVDGRTLKVEWRTSASGVVAGWWWSSGGGGGGRGTAGRPGLRAGSGVSTPAGPVAVAIGTTPVRWSRSRRSFPNYPRRRVPRDERLLQYERRGQFRGEPAYRTTSHATSLTRAARVHVPRLCDSNRRDAVGALRPMRKLLILKRVRWHHSCCSSGAHEIFSRSSEAVRREYEDEADLVPGGGRRVQP